MTHWRSEQPSKTVDAVWLVLFVAAMLAVIVIYEVT